MSKIIHLTNHEIACLDKMKGNMPEQIDSFVGWVESKLNNFDLMIPSCPGKITPSDLDGVLHRKKHGKDWYLFFETKQSVNIDLPRGQKLLLDSLAYNLRPRATVVLLYGKSINNTTHLKWWRYRQDGQIKESDLLKATVDDVAYLVMKWFVRIGDFTQKDLKKAFPNHRG